MDLFHPWGAATVDLFENPGDLSLSDGKAQPKVLQLGLLFGMRIGGIEEIFEIFLPLSNYKLH